MNFYDKIEEIRRKPDQIRVRYVWGCVAFSMVLVIGIWALSIKSRYYQVQNASQVAGQSSIFDELEKQKENLQQYQQEMGGVKNELEKNFQEIQGQQKLQNKEGFSEASNSFNALPENNSADLFQ